MGAIELHAWDHMAARATLIDSDFGRRVWQAPWPSEMATCIPRLFTDLVSSVSESPAANLLHYSLEYQLLLFGVPGEGTLVALPFLCELAERRVVLYEAYSLLAQIANVVDIVLRGEFDFGVGTSPDVVFRVALDCRALLGARVWMFLRDACDQTLCPRVRGEVLVVVMTSPEAEAVWRPVLTEHLAEERDENLRENLRSWLEG